MIDIALADLGDDEWQIRSGATAEAARHVAARLHDDPVPSTNASWHRVDVDLDEYAVIRAALLELAYGTTKSVPSGNTSLQIIDLFEELIRQISH